jgi:DNA-binding response OmpR family regulator
MAHVLVIDDEAPIRALVRQILEAEGYQVSEAADGAAGITLLRTLPVALLITDIFMPGQEGIQTILEVRRHFPQVKLLAISGGTKKMTMDPLPTARALGAHGTLAKPFTPQELLAAVSAVLAH